MEFYLNSCRHGQNSKNMQLKELEENLLQTEKRLAQVTKYLEQKFQKSENNLGFGDEDCTTQAECNQSLLFYRDVFDAHELQKSQQIETAETLEQKVKTVSDEHREAKSELKKILLSISQALSPTKKPQKTKKETSQEEKLEDEKLNAIFEKQHLLEDQVLKLRSQLFLRSNEAQATPFQQHPKKETRILELLIKRENLGRKLEAAQNLLDRQCREQEKIAEERNFAKTQLKALAKEKKTAESDLLMSRFAFHHRCARYSSLQAHHSGLWQHVEAAAVQGDLSILADMEHQQGQILDSLDSEIRFMQQKCKFLDKRLDFYSKSKDRK